MRTATIGQPNMGSSAQEMVEYQPYEIQPIRLIAPVCSTTSTINSTINSTSSSTSAATSSMPGYICHYNETCPVLGVGASIMSPLLLSATGLVGQICALCYLHSNSCTSAAAAASSLRANPPPHSSTHHHHHHQQQQYRTLFHTFLLALIWTDLIGKITTSIPPINAYAHGRWVGGKEACDYHGFSMVLCCLVTHSTVTAMAVERFFGICRTGLHRRHFTLARCRYLIAGIWVFSITFSLLPLLGVGEFYLKYPNTWCFVNIHLCSSTPLRHRFYTISLGVFNVVTTSAMVVCNVLVVRSLLKLRGSSSTSSSCRGQSLGVGQRWWRGQSDLELQTVVVLVIITTLFTLSWVPVDALLLTNVYWAPHVEVSDHHFEVFLVRFSSINQIVDPWAYIICRVVFRSSVWSWCRRGLVGRWKSGRPPPLTLASPTPTPPAATATATPPPAATATPPPASANKVVSDGDQQQQQEQQKQLPFPFPSSSSSSPPPPPPAPLATVSFIPLDDGPNSYSGLELGDGGTFNHSSSTSQQHQRPLAPGPPMSGHPLTPSLTRPPPMWRLSLGMTRSNTWHCPTSIPPTTAP